MSPENPQPISLPLKELVSTCQSWEELYVKLGEQLGKNEAPAALGVVSWLANLWEKFGQEQNPLSRFGPNPFTSRTREKTDNISSHVGGKVLLPVNFVDPIPVIIESITIRGGGVFLVATARLALVQVGARKMLNLYPVQEISGVVSLTGQPVGTRPDLGKENIVIPNSLARTSSEQKLYWAAKQLAKGYKEGRLGLTAEKPDPQTQRYDSAYLVIPVPDQFLPPESPIVSTI